MTTVYPSAIYDRLLDYLIEKATPQEILAFAPTEAEQARANDLLERQSAGELTPEEQVELEQMRYFDELVGVLKARARAAQKRR